MFNLGTYELGWTWLYVAFVNRTDLVNSLKLIIYGLLME